MPSIDQVRFCVSTIRQYRAHRERGPERPPLNRVSASDSLHLSIKLRLEHTFWVVAVGSFFTVFTIVAVVPSLPIIASIVAVSFDRAPRTSSVIVVSIPPSVITVRAIVLAWRELASAWWRWRSVGASSWRTSLSSTSTTRSSVAASVESP